MLDSLLATDVYTYLKQCKEIMSIAVLLGLAASRIGTKEEKALKALRVHIHCLLHKDNNELKIDQMVESCSLFSIGLLFAESSNQTHSDMMLS